MGGSYVRTEEHREKLAARNRARTGWHHSEESKAKSRLAHLGVPKPEGFREKMRVLRTGFKHSKESIDKMCRQQSLSGNARWKGGKTINEQGYVLIKDRTHPFRKGNDYVPEHRLVMEKHIGRYLTPEEVVHHINENRSDNRIENLMLFPSQSEHRKFHIAQRKRIDDPTITARTENQSVQSAKD